MIFMNIWDTATNTSFFGHKSGGIGYLRFGSMMGWVKLNVLSPGSGFPKYNKQEWKIG
jgi:hypothetical protein